MDACKAITRTVRIMLLGDSIHAGDQIAERWFQAINTFLKSTK
jgi:hypothetical protein